MFRRLILILDWTEVVLNCFRKKNLSVYYRVDPTSGTVQHTSDDIKSLRYGTRHMTSKYGDATFTSTFIRKHFIGF